MPTLKVTVGGRDRLNERTQRRIAAAREGEDIEDAQPVLNVGSYTEMYCLLSPANLELLEEIAAHEPDNIRAAAELFNRDYRQLHRTLHELADIGVIEFEGDDLGRAKKPTLAYDGLEIEISFADTDERPRRVPR